MIPHWHMAAGPIPEDRRIKCWKGKRLEIASYDKRWLDCECVAHEFSRTWFAVTGDSYVVHTTPVSNGLGAGNYMAKYLSKTFGSEARLKELGMSRRWSSSRGWPGSGQLRLDPSVNGEWTERVYERGRLDRDKVDSGTFTRVGTSPEMVKFFLEAKERNARRRFGKVFNVKDVRA